MLSIWSSAGSIILSGRTQYPRRAFLPERGPGKTFRRQKVQKTREDKGEKEDREERRHDPRGPAVGLGGEEVSPRRAEQGKEREEDRGDDECGQKPSPPAPLPAAHPDPRERGGREIHRCSHRWICQAKMPGPTGKPRMEMRVELARPPLPGVRA